MAKKKPQNKRAKAFAEKTKEDNLKLSFEMKLKKSNEAKREAESKLQIALAQIEQLESHLEASRAHARRAQVRYSPPKHKGRSGNASVVLQLGDWHVEECVRPDEVNDLNINNLEVSKLSSEDFTDNAARLIEHEGQLAKIEEVVVFLAGDFISGHIHDELTENNLLAPLPASLFAADLLEVSLRKLLDVTRVPIRVVCCDGNHGRSTKKTRAAGRVEHSYETNMYMHLARRFSRHSRMRWTIASGYHVYEEIQGRTVRFHHGDALRYLGGVGGLAIPANKAIAQWNQTRKADIDMFGHFHQLLWHRNWICNGSGIGFNAYALQIKAVYEPPQQVMAIIDRDRGLTRVLPVFCRSRKPLIEKWYKEQQANKYALAV